MNLNTTLYNEIRKLIDNTVFVILSSSVFFMNEYIIQEFKQTSRFKYDKIHGVTHIPLKESHKRKLNSKQKTSVIFSSGNNQNQELQLSNFVNQAKPKL